MIIEVEKMPDMIELKNSKGIIICRYKRCSGTWQSFTDKVNIDGHWGRFLVYEELNKSGGDKK